MQFEVAPEGCDQKKYDAFCKHNKHEGEYVELQNGPGASQRHSFPVDGRSTYEWTEYLSAFDGDVGKLQDKDYAVANAEVTRWLESAEGVSSHAVEEADTFMASISGVPPEPADVMQEAGPFGALQEQLHADEW